MHELDFRRFLVEDFRALYFVPRPSSELFQGAAQRPGFLLKGVDFDCAPRHPDQASERIKLAE
jgi:hypothetical protein